MLGWLGVRIRGEGGWSRRLVRRRLIGCRALLDLSFEDPRGLADRSRHIGQPFGAEQQHHHGEQDERCQPVKPAMTVLG